MDSGNFEMYATPFPDGGMRPDALLADVAEGYRAMDERRAIETLLRA